MLMEAGGGQRTVLDDASGMTFAPRFSPDGRRAVFSMSVGTGSDIFVTDLGARGRVQLTRGGSSINTAPSFSPDGNQIVFESDRGGTQQLYVMSAAGGEARRISFGDGRYATPVWSPRGDMIAFTKIVGGRFHIGVMRTDGSNEKLLTGSYLDEGPTWAPNGRVLMFFRESSGDERRAAALFGGHHRAQPAPGADGRLRLRPVVVGAAGMRQRRPEGAGKDGTMRFTCGYLAVVLLAAACAGGDVTVPGSPDGGFSGTEGSLGALGPGGAAGAGTLPGSAISDRVLFAVDQTTLSPEAIGTLERPGRLAAAEPGRADPDRGPRRRARHRRVQHGARLQPGQRGAQLHGQPGHSGQPHLDHHLRPRAPDRDLRRRELLVAEPPRCHGCDWRGGRLIR